MLPLIRARRWRFVRRNVQDSARDMSSYSSESSSWFLERSDDKLETWLVQIN